MIFDVMVREGYKYSEQQKCNVQVINVYRVRDSALSAYLRNVQDVGHYIVSVIPLFRSKMKQMEPFDWEKELEKEKTNAIDSNLRMISDELLYVMSKEKDVIDPIDDSNMGF